MTPGGAIAFPDLLAWLLLVSSPFVFLFLSYTTAPFGKHAQRAQQNDKRRRWPMLPSHLAWCFMESPNLVWSSYHYLSSSKSLPPRNTCLLLLFALHYSQRSLIYPFLQRGATPVPLHVFLSALAFCSLNGYLQAEALCRGSKAAELEPGLEPGPDPLFLPGVLLFLAGFAANLHSDAVLRNLRGPSDPPGTYRIPRGGLFELVSGANHLAESLEWIGFAVAAGRTAVQPWAFAAFTVANVAPRAKRTHEWYEHRFGDEYEKLKRKAFVPGVW